MANFYKLYAKVNKHNAETIEFMGTMKELCEYTGSSQNTIRAYMSRCAKENRFCPYILIGNIRDDETEEEKRERRRIYSKKWRMNHG